eukprot:7379033-Prymnesium_polylepis.1
MASHSSTGDYKSESVCVDNISMEGHSTSASTLCNLRVVLHAVRPRLVTRWTAAIKCRHG